MQTPESETKRVFTKSPFHSACIIICISLWSIILGKIVWKLHMDIFHFPSKVLAFLIISFAFLPVLTILEKYRPDERFWAYLINLFAGLLHLALVFIAVWVIYMIAPEGAEGKQPSVQQPMQSARDSTGRVAPARPASDADHLADELNRAVRNKDVPGIDRALHEHHIPSSIKALHYIDGQPVTFQNLRNHLVDMTQGLDSTVPVRVALPPGYSPAVIDPDSLLFIF